MNLWHHTFIVLAERVKVLNVFIRHLLPPKHATGPCRFVGHIQPTAVRFRVNCFNRKHNRWTPHYHFSLVGLSLLDNIGHRKKTVFWERISPILLFTHPSPPGQKGWPRFHRRTSKCTTFQFLPTRPPGQKGWPRFHRRTSKCAARLSFVNNLNVTIVSSICYELTFATHVDLIFVISLFN